LTEHNRRLQSGKRGFDAEMDTRAEGDVALGCWPIEAVPARIVEVYWVATQGCVDGSFGRQR
jgi:hypothetical protein